ncbi:MAG: hypothetical protein HN560_04195 [Anaerolineae bacterium]|jgi:hypothetical protein|nr:hypothetical protein [Anaerolineae bacterium]
MKSRVARVFGLLAINKQMPIPSLITIKKASHFVNCTPKGGQVIKRA